MLHEERRGCGRRLSKGLGRRGSIVSGYAEETREDAEWMANFRGRSRIFAFIRIREALAERGGAVGKHCFWLRRRGAGRCGMDGEFPRSFAHFRFYTDAGGACRKGLGGGEALALRAQKAFRGRAPRGVRRTRSTRRWSVGGAGETACRSAARRNALATVCRSAAKAVFRGGVGQPLDFAAGGGPDIEAGHAAIG